MDPSPLISPSFWDAFSIIQFALKKEQNFQHPLSTLPQPKERRIYLIMSEPSSLALHHWRSDCSDESEDILWEHILLTDKVTMPKSTLPCSLPWACEPWALFEVSLAPYISSLGLCLPLSLFL